MGYRTSRSGHRGILWRRAKHSRVKVAAGLPRQALTSLTSDGLAPHGPATFAKLKGKHPTAPSVHGDMKNPSGPADFTTKEVMAATSSMLSHCRWPVKPDRVTPPHLVQPKAHPWHACCLTKVLSSLAKGEAHRSVATFFADAKLVALMKMSKGKPDDVRPIAMGDATRRLIGKILANSYKRAAEIFRKGNHVGVWTTRSSEADTPRQPSV